MNSLPWSVFLLAEANGETEKKKKKPFSAVEDFTPFWWHSGTQKPVGRKNKTDQIDDEAGLFWGSIVKTKHERLTSLAFMRLIPGADQVVRYISIRCLKLQR